MTLYYLSSPYHGTDSQESERSKLASQACAAFLKEKIPVFSPVLHNHALANNLRLTRDQRRALLMPIDLELLKRATGMIMLKLEGWKESQGMKEEILFCQSEKIPYYELELQDVLGKTLRFERIIATIRETT